MLFVLVLGPLLLEWLFPLFWRLSFSWPGPLSALEAADDSSYRRDAGPYWISIVVMHALSWLLVLGAGMRLRNALREEDESPARGAIPASGHKAPPDFMLANIKINFQGPKPLAEGQAPLAWLLRRQRGVRMVVWAGALLGASYSGMLFFVGLSRWGSYFSWGMSLAFAVVEGCLFAWAASRFFIESRRSGELELLMTTPEGARNIVASQWKWLKNVFAGPTVALVAPSAVMSLMRFLLLRYQRWDGYALYSISAQLISCASIIVGLVALVWFGMWCGWTERSQGRAIVRIVLIAKGAPYLIGLFGSIVIRRVEPMSFYSNPQFIFSPILFAHVLFWNMPQIVVLLYYIYLFRWSRRRLGALLGPSSPKSGLDSLLKFIYQPG
jgi:hypothetical protein